MGYNNNLANNSVTIPGHRTCICAGINRYNSHIEHHCPKSLCTFLAPVLLKSQSNLVFEKAGKTNTKTTQYAGHAHSLEASAGVKMTAVDR